MHPNAELAAEAAEAAASQEAFWEMHDRLFSHPDQLDATDLVGHAAELGLDVERFSRELGTGVHAPRVRADVSSAEASGAEGTPTFFVNGRRRLGRYDAEALAEGLAPGRPRAPIPRAEDERPRRASKGCRRSAGSGAPARLRRPPSSSMASRRHPTTMARSRG